MEIATEPPFEPGQVVVYKSGGAKMVVVKCLPLAEVPVPWNGQTGSPEKWDCDWGVRVNWMQDDGVHQERVIDPRLIEVYRTDIEKAMEAAAHAVENFKRGETSWLRNPAS